MNLFIDTSIYLSFYGYSSEALEELKKLTVAVRKNKITLYLPDQIEAEFRRRREGVIADSIEKLENFEIPHSFPEIYKEFEEFDKLRKASKFLNIYRGILSNKVKDTVEDFNFEADKIILNLFSKAKVLETNPKILELAKLRYECGNPPGKNKSLGDSICWELLLEHIPDEDLIILADDNDYISEIDRSKIKHFLRQEWAKRKKSKILLYKRLTDFFQAYFPEIKLATQLDKQYAINDLVNSSTFSVTHKAIEELSRFQDYSLSQAQEILLACVNNEQIYWIGQDEDVFSFLLKIYEKNKEQITSEIAADFESKYLKNKTPEENEEIKLDEIPF